ncbi:zinc ribbon domain-containing protein YjdM [uncultured Algimonas sp.]|uniref:zinc ribbon domain-containing protein YjdM n=1 Tax=uncultured Algimonas sp. TaxID=1547920 RepID=UPI0026294301|nr:zinc ribbon domain-containing protein YjdM [uncultured Algimonas sp.]
MTDTPPCPECGSDYVYPDGPLLICPECAHEWAAADAAPSKSSEKVYRDANGNILEDGDNVTLIKDLKVKGTSKTVKVGTKVRIIRLIDEDHDIDCRIDGIGAMKLKTEFVKKA